MGKGMLFSLDFSIAFLLMLVMVLVFALYVFSFVSEREAEFLENSEKRERVMLLDSLLKRRSPGKMPGLALFDASKRRTMENRVAGGLAEHALLEEAGLSELWMECGTGKHTVYNGEQNGMECAVYSRIAYLNGNSCVLRARFCGG